MQLPRVINRLLWTDVICFFMLPRNIKSLRLLSGWCRPTTSKGQRPCRVGQVPPLDRLAATSFLAAHGMSLVWVRLSLLSKGKPERHAVVCVPTAEDLQLLKKGPGSSGPQEPQHRDHFKSRIKRRKRGPKKAAASSAKAEGKEPDLPSASEPDPKSASEPNATTSEEPKSSSDLIFGLWPDPLPSVTSHCSRVTLGWVTQGDFSLSAGCGEALGFVSVVGLLNTLVNQPREHRGMFLLRNPASLHYRFAKINIEIWLKHLCSEHAKSTELFLVNGERSSRLISCRGLKLYLIKLHDASVTKWSLCLDNCSSVWWHHVLCRLRRSNDKHGAEPQATWCAVE